MRLIQSERSKVNGQTGRSLTPNRAARILTSEASTVSCLDHSF